MISQFNSVLATALTPITLISGVGLLMLCMTNRYNHATDRIRQLIKKREETGLAIEPDIDAEIRLIFHRASLLRRAMLCVALSATFSGLLVATNTLSSFMDVNLVLIDAIWLVLAIALIVISTAFFSMEINISLRALALTVDHLPTTEPGKPLPSGLSDKIK